MKILIYGDYFRWKSGYAREISDILPYLKQNNEVRQVALGYNGYPRDREMVIYHTKTPEVKDYYAQEVLHYAIDDFNPDIVLTVQDFCILPKISFTLAHPGKFKWIHWGTLDSDPVDYYSRESLRWIHYCLCQSKFGEKEIKKIEPNIEISTLYPSVNPNVFYQLKTPKTKLKVKYGLEGNNIIICTARGQQRKNVPVLLDAFQKLLEKIPNTILILASGIKNTKTDAGTLDGYDIDRFVEEKKLINNVFLPRTMEQGPIDDRTLNLQYNLADINVLASWGEGFGLPFIESGISYVPSIGIDHSAVTEILENRGLLVKPVTYAYNLDGSRYWLCDYKDLAAKMEELLTDEQLRIKLGKVAYEFAKTLTPESRAEKMLQIFEKVIKDNIQPLAR